MARTLSAVVFLVIVSCLLQAVNVTSGVCPVSWMQHGGFCYKQMMEPKPSMEARCECRKHGAIVATLSTPAKTDFINTLVNGTIDRYIIGADRLRDDWFVWMDGVPLDHNTFNWKRNQPDNKDGKENYLAYTIDTTVSGTKPKFYTHYGMDVGPNYKGLYVCEKTATGKGSGRKWKLRREGVIYPDDAMSEYTLSSKLQCGSQCMRNCLCHSFSYNALSRRCILYNAYYRRLTGSPVNDEHSVLYD